MIRVHIRESREECTLVVEGAIDAMAAAELEGCWRSLACAGQKTVVLDVRGVQRVDKQCRGLLRDMHRNGVKFSGGRLAIADTIDEIVSSSEI